jgi:hypothetical protein
MYYKGDSQARHAITIRQARGEDRRGLRRLDRDSAEIPVGELLVALVGEELRAAISVTDGKVIADPFHPTAELVRLLSARAKQLQASNGGPRRGLRGILRDRQRYAAA